MVATAKPKLILLNGSPAVGKTSVARRYADEHPLTLHLDVDGVRDMIVGWQADPIASGHRARAMIEAMAASYLGSGNDVIVSQLYGRVAGIELLEEVARAVEAVWVEIALVAPLATIEERFVARDGSQLEALAAADRTVSEQLSELHERLGAAVSERPGCALIDTSDGDYDAVYDQVVETIAAAGRR